MNRPLLLICLGYLFVTLAYGVVNPLFEAPDEHHHYFTAQFIAENRRLPSMADSDKFIKQEAAQPPLYYWLGSWLIRPIDTTSAQTDLWFNPHVRLGAADAPANRNHFVHPSADWNGYILAAHLLRGLSTLFGLGTLLCIFASTQLLTTRSAALLTTGIVAFLPQFNFLHSYVNNDVAIIFCASLVIFQLIRLWITLDVRWTTFSVLGVSIGLAMLSKTAGILLFAYALGFLTCLAIISRWRWQQWFHRVTITGGSTLAVAGWLLWRNWKLYSDPTAANQFVLAAGGDRNVTLWQVLQESSGLWRSLIGVFGWFNVIAPTWVYAVWISLILLVIVGIGLRAIAADLSSLKFWKICFETWLSSSTQSYRPDRTGVTPRATQMRPINGAVFSPIDGARPVAPGFIPVRKPVATSKSQSDPKKCHTALLLLLLLGWLLTVYAGMVAFMLQTTAAQGRLLLPALLPIAALFSYGIAFWQRKTGYSLMLIIGCLALISLYSLLFVIRPVYALPTTVAQLPTDVTQIGVQLGDNVELVGAKLRTTTAQAGDNVWVDLYWRADALPDEPPEVVLELFGYNGAQSGRIQAYHGGGLYPTTLWTVGDIVQTRVGATLNDEINAPTQVRVNVRIVDGEAVDLGYLKVPPTDSTNVESQSLAQIGEEIEVISADYSPKTAKIGETITVSVTWRVLQSVEQTLTTFVHVGSADAPPLAQGDSQPRNSNYPTHWWEAGEIIHDNYQITLSESIPTGTYPLRIGMYDTTITPLPLKIGENFPPSRSLIIGEITVDN